MIIFKNILKGIFVKDKLIRQIYFGNQKILDREILFPNYNEEDRQHITLNNAVINEWESFQFSRSGTVETNVVTDSYEIYAGGIDGPGYPSHNATLYTIYILNAYTKEQIFKITLNTGPNTSGYSDIADRYFISTIYDKNNNKIGSITRTGAYGNLYPHAFWYDFENNKYVLDGSGFTDETTTVEINETYTPFIIKIQNSYSGTNPIALNFATSDYIAYKGTGVYKNYKV